MRKHFIPYFQPQFDAVTAEGVETLEHAHILRDMGCTTLQGYYFARPMDGASLLAFIAKEAWRDTPAMGERAA